MTYDVLFVDEECDVCDETIRRKVQFKIGTDPHLREYVVGSRVVALTDKQASGDLLVEGTPWECPKCDCESLVMHRAVWLRQGVIAGVRPWRSWERFAEEMYARRDGTYAARPEGLPFDELE